MPFDGTSLSPVAQALIAGRRYIENGWCKGVMRSPDGSCMIGALHQSGGSWEQLDAGALLLLRAIAALGYQTPMRDTAARSVADWQDDIARTKEQVLQVYDRAIELSLNS